MASASRQLAGRFRKIWAGLGVVGGLWAGTGAEAGQTYLALGDSVTFGVGANDTAKDISSGDRGYVAGYADALGGPINAYRPNVINLAVSGETSSSFFGVGVGLDGAGASARNVNYAAANLPATYTGLTPPSQDALMQATIAAQQAAGNTISTVTMTLGANDLFAALAAKQSPLDALATFQQNEVKLLGEIRGLLPTTNLILLGYFNPYAPFLNDPDHDSDLYKIAQQAALAIPAINSYIRADAAAFGASYVDLYRPFQGLELADTYIATGNVHPNVAGYALITASMESVPEPGSVVLLGLGLLTAAVATRRRLARPAA